ncbi:MAG: TrmH family RNA methyltransferase [Vicinamibacterales bacterium]|jgi:tRNA G18 (ribose-2'-O)-methylase SpoU
MTPELETLLPHTADPRWLLAHGYFVAEGRSVVRRLLEAGSCDVRGLVLTPPAEAAMADTLASMATDARPPVATISQAEMDALTGFRLHQGCVAFARRPELSAWTVAHTSAGVSILLERVRDPDNVGSIMRSAAALGVQTLVLGPECADPLYRKAVRTSMGAIFALTVVRAEPWPEVLAGMRISGARLIAATPDPAAIVLDELPASDAPTILMVGSEGDGLSAEALAAADVCVRIPMSNAIDSLNVAVATAVAVYALQRGKR